MKRIIFILAALAFASLASAANAACSGGTCFWVGGTGTLNLTSDSAHWSTSSGGTTCSCEPASTDDITFDGSSGGGTVTVTIAGGTWTANSITMGAFTGTLDFATSNNNVTLAGNAAFNNSGAGTRTLNMGNGTWTLSSNSALFQQSTVTGLTYNANGSTIAFTGTGGTNFRRFLGGGKTFNILTVAGSANAPLIISGSNTFATLTISAPNYIQIVNGTTQTVTTITNVTGSAGSEVAFESNDLTSGQFTISSANNWTCTWCSFFYGIFTGGGTFTATNSFTLGNNTGITITAPSVGGGGGGRIIGG